MSINNHNDTAQLFADLQRDAQLDTIHRYRWPAVIAVTFVIVLTSVWQFWQHRQYQKTNQHAAFYEKSAVGDANQPFPYNMLSGLKSITGQTPLDEAFNTLDTLENSSRNAVATQILVIKQAYISLARDPAAVADILKKLPKDSFLRATAQELEILAMLAQNNAAAARAQAVELLKRDDLASTQRERMLLLVQSLPQER